MTEYELTVLLHREVDIELERLLSPLDEVEFLNQLQRQLPIQHRKQTSSKFKWLRANSLKIYRGNIDWCGVDFLYVCFGNHLHILDFHEIRNEYRHRFKIDVQLGEPDPDNVEVIDCGNGIRIAS